jgi:hypothetical protein
MDETKKVTYADKDASWEIYVELNTKMTTQLITQSYNNKSRTGDTRSALTSIYSIFPETRLILKQYGLIGKQFARLAFEMLNTVIKKPAWCAPVPIKPKVVNIAIPNLTYLPYFVSTFTEI